MKIVDGVRRYNQWAGNPAGTPENPTRCIVEVRPNDLGGYAHRHQCGRKRGHGIDGLYCKQHSPDATAARKAARDERYRRWSFGFKIDAARRNVSDLAQMVYRQQASFDDLERAVMELEQLIAEHDRISA